MTKHGSNTNRRRFLKATGAGIGLATLAGCSGGDGGGGGGDGGDGGDGSGDGGSTGDGGDGGMGPIVIAALEPQSGPFSVYGPRHLQGAEFAAAQINANGGINGRDVEIVSTDTGSDPQTAVTALTRFMEQENAVAAIGPVSSDAAIQTSNFAEQEEIPLLLHAAGASTILSMDSRYTFRTALPAVPTVAKAIARILEGEGYTEVAYVIEDGAWGAEFQAGVDAYWPDDMNVTTATAPIPETDFIPYLRQFPDDVEVICGTAHPAGISSMYPQIQELGIELDLYTAAITAMQVDYQAVGDSIGNSFVSFNSPDLYSDTFAEVAQTYYDETGGMFDTAQANGYVSVDLLTQAVSSGGSSEPAEIASSLRSGSFDTVYANTVEYTEWGEVDGSINIFNGFDVGSSPEWYPDGSFAPTEFYRTEPLEPFEPGSLGLQ